MRSIIGIITSTLLLMGLATWLTVVFYRESNELIGYAMDVREACEKNNAHEAHQAAERFGLLWDHCTSTWKFFSNQQDITQISIAFTELNHLLAEAKLSEADLAAARLLLLINTIHEKELPHIANIL